MGTDQYKANDFIDKIPGSAGIISTIAARVGCTWHTAKKYIDEYPTINQAYKNECETTVDMAESKLLEAIESGDNQMIKYYLSTKGKYRGFTERQEHKIEADIAGKIELKGYTVLANPDLWLDEPENEPE
jgi:hypothetical protein